MRPANSELFPQSQGRGDDGAARMRPSRSEIVVGFIGMSQLPVCERRLNGAAEDRRGDNRGNLLATVVARELDRQASGEQLGSRNHGSKSVQNVMLCLPRHILRQRTVASLSHICAEFFHDWADILGESHCQAWKR